MLHGLQRRQLMGIGYQDSFQIHSHSDYLRQHKQEFFTSLTSWYRGLFVVPTEESLLQNTYKNSFVSHLVSKQ